MMLSDEQMVAATAGLNLPQTWSIIDRPAGPQPIPSWCKDAAIDYVDGYSNRPRYVLKVTDGVYDWGDTRWKRVGSRFIREHEDGRFEQHGHSGAIVSAKLRRWRRHEDGKLFTYPPEGHGMKWNPETNKVEGGIGEWVEVELRCTTEQQGYGGRHFEIMMDDGEPLILRGPWHIGSPSGFMEVGYDMAGKAATKADLKFKRKWWQRGGYFGLFLREDAFVRIMSRYHAHVEFAEIRKRGEDGYRLEAVRPEFGMPKTIKQDIDWAELCARREAEKQAKAGAA